MLFSRKSQRHSGLLREPEDAKTFAEEWLPVTAPSERHVVAAPRGADEAYMQSFIDASLTIVGDLHSERDVRIDGHICGNVSCAQLIVSPGAVITGSITAQEAIVRGKITGTIRALTVIIQETAHVESEITYGKLVIDDGAFFEGAVRRSRNPLAETVGSPLADLQRVMHADEAAPEASNGAFDKAGNGSDIGDEAVAGTTAVTVHASATGGKPALTNGHAPVANGHDAVANGHDPHG